MRKDGNDASDSYESEESHITYEGENPFGADITYEEENPNVATAFQARRQKSFLALAVDRIE